MNGRGTLYLLLAVVAGAAAMLSFAALRDLALLCGFGYGLAWLLPVVVDAGAAAGSLVWLGPATAARVFARRLALGLLALSVAANALGHGLAAYQLAPPWWVVVVLSGIAPAVLGAMVHLAVLVGRPALLTEEHDAEDEQVADVAAAVPDDTAPEFEPEEAATSFDEHSLPWTWKPGLPGAQYDADAAANGTDRAVELIAAGAGRRRLSRELGVTEYEARRLLERARPTDSATTTADPAVLTMGVRP